MSLTSFMGQFDMQMHLWLLFSYDLIEVQDNGGPPLGGGDFCRRGTVARYTF